MKDLCGHVRAAIDKYNMISPGDRIAVAVSGGKDSVYLLDALYSISLYYPAPFTLAAITADPCFGGVHTDFSEISSYCEERKIPHIIRRTDLAQTVFSDPDRPSPCSLCARMRRGILHNMCLENGLGKVALGHHLDDAVQTFFMNLLYGGKIGCFSPVTWLSQKRLTMIRPLVFCEERDIRKVVDSRCLPTVKSGCPVDGKTSRSDTADFLRDIETQFPDIKSKVLGAMQRKHIDRWGI